LTTLPEHDVHGDRAVYDHEIEEPGTARRRRPVADWGVGEEIFDRLPRHRFVRTPEPPRRDSHPRDPQPVARERAAAESPARERRVEPKRDARPASAPRPASAAPQRPRSATDRGGAGDGRRTIVIGHSASTMPAPRRRPPRTVGERVGHRPDRLAMWAFALGMLLILIAVATQNS
jgi:hypothetical protein